MLTRRVLALGFCVFALSATSALAADGATAGIVAGINSGSAKLTGSDAAGVDTQCGSDAAPCSGKIGLFIGGYAQWPITGALSIQPEVAYSQKHFTVKDSVSGFTATEKWDWLEVPVLARVRLGHTGGGAFYLVGGPNVAFKLRAKEKTGGQTSDVKDDVQNVDFSVIGGGGYAIHKLGVEFRYNAGVRDLNKDHKLGDNLKVKSQAITIDVTWALR